MISNYLWPLMQLLMRVLSSTMKIIIMLRGYVLIYHNIAFHWQQTHVPPLQAILMAMRTCWSNARGISQCCMARDTPDNPGSHHRTATCSVSPWQLSGRQATNNDETTPSFAGHIKAVVVRRYNTARIARRRRSMASLEATGHHHRASTCSNNIHRTCLRTFF